jgi:hypothetical protein
MGLLDDAIREHLELKRQHGGDPSEIERQEREAFGPGGRRTAPVDDAAAPADDDAAEAPDDDATQLHEPPEPPTEAPEDYARVTMDPEPGEYDEAGPDGPESDEEEVDPPPDAGRDEDAPGHDEDPWLVEDIADPDLEKETEEDVLEETPDFLQETPEHDRLWFEQKPPRDFDWDK